MFLLWVLLYIKGCNPKGPCAQIVQTLAPKYLKRDSFKAKVYTLDDINPALPCGP